MIHLPFTAFNPFSQNTMSRRNVSNYFRGQQNQSIIAASLQKGAGRGGTLRSMGATRNSTAAAVAGINNRLINPTSSILQKGVGHASNISMKAVRALGKLGGGIVKSPKTHIALGITAMAGVAFMNGAMNQANDIMIERYMRDARYSNRMLSATSLGQASANSPLSMGNTVGLSIALHRTRHGH